MTKYIEFLCAAHYGAHSKQKAFLISYRTYFFVFGGVSHDFSLSIIDSFDRTHSSRAHTSCRYSWLLTNVHPFKTVKCKHL